MGAIWALMIIRSHRTTIYWTVNDYLKLSDIRETQVQRVVVTAQDSGSCIADLIPSEGGSGTFGLSFTDPFTGRTERTDALDFDTPASEVNVVLSSLPAARVEFETPAIFPDTCVSYSIARSSLVQLMHETNLPW